MICYQLLGNLALSEVQLIESQNDAVLFSKNQF